MIPQMCAGTLTRSARGNSESTTTVTTAWRSGENTVWTLFRGAHCCMAAVLHVPRGVWHMCLHPRESSSSKNPFYRSDRNILHRLKARRGIQATRADDTSEAYRWPSRGVDRPLAFAPPSYAKISSPQEAADIAEDTIKSADSKMMPRLKLHQACTERVVDDDASQKVLRSLIP